ncbi:hypothetical protein H696_05933 [Fonticula alba]|uniref:Chloride channel protein n=1 Tax=Fonticula alba TaxID=691883 RepID=A0A058Z0I8_FONAL|nr:hypothetical protein H696_05933 [Fonticula alba]KCV67646.1 hypothetical protein H696_05933 [Fonticula alba]|eukprot:XP_009497984.1 hypothetical protein H696_05933 [Fonticula alba]
MPPSTEGLPGDAGGRDSPDAPPVPHLGVSPGNLFTTPAAGSLSSSWQESPDMLLDLNFAPSAGSPSGTGAAGMPIAGPSSTPAPAPAADPIPWAGYSYPQDVANLDRESHASYFPPAGGAGPESDPGPLGPEYADQAPTAYSSSVRASRRQGLGAGLAGSESYRRAPSAQTLQHRIKAPNLSTIDWTFELTLEHQRKIDIKSRSSSLQATLAKGWDQAQGWVIVGVTAISCALIAAFLAVSTDFLSSLRIGYCKGAWHLGESLCCLNQWPAPGGSFDGTSAVAPFSLEPQIELHCPDFITWAQWSESWAGGYLMYMLISVCLAVSSAIIVKRVSPFSAGSGIPEVKVILGGFVMHGFLGASTAILKTLTLALAMASGMLVGKEGPLIHIAASLGNIWPRFFPKYHASEVKKRELISSAVAAGVAVAFGAPLGGVLFSFEECSYYFPNLVMLRTIFCAVVGAAAIWVIDPLHTGKLVIFSSATATNATAGWLLVEFIPFVGLGLITGALGALFIKLHIVIMRARRLPNSFTKRFPVTEIFLLALLSAAIQYHLAYTRIDMLRLMGFLFGGCDPNQGGSDPLGLCKCVLNSVGPIIAGLLATAAIKYCLFVLTAGSRVPSGMFVPTMLTGALIGRVVGILMSSWAHAMPTLFIWSSCASDPSTCISPGLYAAAAAAGFLTGTTRITISAAVIIFEITGAVNFLLPTIVCVIVAKWTGDAIHRLDSPVIVSDSHPMLSVIDMFRQLGIRVVLVQREGSLVGIISKKDVVRHMLEVQRAPRQAPS